MRVLFIINSSDAKFPVDTAKRLADTDTLEIKVIPLLGPKPIKRSGWEKIVFFLRTPTLIRQIREAVQEYKPDIIHTHFWLSDLIGERAARPFPSIKLVSTQHDEVRPSALISVLKRRALRRFSRVIAISKSVAQFSKSFFGVPAEKITTIYNGIAIDRFARGTKDDTAWRPTIGLIARLEKIKGGDIFMEALCRLIIREQMIRAMIVGSGSQRTKLEARARKANVGDRIKFLHYQPDLIPILRELDIVVVPSRSEGLSVTILEALASKKLVIASDIGGVPELITNRQNGLLVPAGDVSALANAMQWATSHSEESLAIRNRGAQWLLSHRATFDIAEVIKKYYQLYNNLIARETVS